MKTATFIGAAALVLLILLYGNGYFRSTDRTEGRSQLPGTQGIPQAQAELQRVAREAERQRPAQEEAERQRMAREEADRQARGQQEERQRVAREAERQRKAQEQADSERQRKAKEEERKRVASEEVERERLARERIEAERERVSREEENKRRNDLEKCLQKAEAAYSASWELACRQIDSPPKCILPPAVRGRFDGPRQESRDECARLYSAK